MTFFTIPLMFFACLEWSSSDPISLKIEGFKFEQPVTVVAYGTSRIEIRDVEFVGDNGPCIAHLQALRGGFVEMTGPITFRDRSEAAE